MGLLALGGAFAAQLGGNLLKTASSRRSLADRRKRELAALEPARRQLQALNFGATASEGALFKAVERKSLASLGRRGVIRGSTAPSEVAQALAPVESQFQQRREDLSFGLAAATARIEGDTELPGFGAAFGGTLGDAGSFLALRDTLSSLREDEDPKKDEDEEEDDGVSLTKTLLLMKAAGVDVDEDQFSQILNFTSFLR